MVHDHACRLAGPRAAALWRGALSRLASLAAGLLLITMAGPLCAAATYPPVEQATFHQLMFANDNVAVLKNVYPPHSDSGYHVHSRELFYVVISPARFGSQKLGQELKTPPLIPAGGTGYNVMTTEPFIHRVVNDDDQTCEIIAIELRRAMPSGKPVSVRPADYIQIFDNVRMRAWRLVLAPGQSVPAMNQTANGVRVVVRGGSMVTVRPMVRDQALALQPGDASMQLAGESRALRNTGTTPIELVEIELK